MTRRLLISDHCPCCGGPIAGLAHAWILDARLLVGCGHVVELTQGEAQIFDELWKARQSGRRLTPEALYARIFSGDPTGGPGNWNHVRTQMWWLRKKLRAVGLRIDSISGHDYGYRLVAAPIAGRDGAA